MVDTVRGVLRVRKWPRKRGTSTHPNNIFWVDWFRQANLLVKYADEMSQRRAKEMTAGQAVYPRDVMLAAMRGRLYQWVDETGWRWYPVAGIFDVSESLDFLAQTVGGVLVRAPDRWRAAAEPAIGRVLTYQGANLAPKWAPIAGTAVFGGGCVLTKSANQSIPNTTPTDLTFDQEGYDTDNFHSTTVQNHKIIIPAGYSWARCTAGVRWSPVNIGVRTCDFKKNGSFFPGSGRSEFEGNNQVLAYTMSSAVTPVVAGDEFTMNVWHNRGAALNVLNAADLTFFAVQVWV